MPAGTGTTVIRPTQVLRSYNFDVPCEGAETIPLALDLATFAEVDVDLSQLVDQAKISMVQSMFIDNSAAGAAFVAIIDPNGINQSIVTNANTQGYFPILAPNPTQIKFQSQAGIVIRVQLINAPIAGFVWAATHP